MKLIWSFVALRVVHVTKGKLFMVQPIAPISVNDAYDYVSAYGFGISITMQSFD